jgi:aminocarboxymuconate-semialdehyde decarboxylase
MVLGAAGASMAASAAFAGSKEKPMAKTASPTAAAKSDGGVVDVHAHVIMPSYQALITGFGYTLPGYGSAPAAKLPPQPPAPAPAGPPRAVLDNDEAVAQRLALMDEAGVARQVLSTIYAPYFEDEGHAAAAARHVNDIHAGIVRKHPSRFSSFVALPLPHIDASLAELKRGMDELGMLGVNIQCFCLDRSVADDHFNPIYEELNRREAVVFFHPCVNGICSTFITEWGLNGTVGPVSEDTVVATHLIIKQIPRRYPKIKFIVPHFGGVLPMLLNRLDNQLGLTIPGLPEKPSITARRFWYDSVGHGSKAACACAVEAFGDRKILPGSDYPVLLPFESYHQTFDYIRHLGLPEETVERILYSNARDLFGAGIDQPGPMPPPRRSV